MYRVGRAQIRAQFPCALSAMARTPRRSAGVTLAIASASGLLAATLLASAPAGASPSAAYAVTEVPVATSADNVATDSVTNTIYAAVDAQPYEIAVIDGATNAVIADIPLAFVPQVVAVDPSTDTIYAIGRGTGTADVINGATNSVTATISLPSVFEPFAAAVNPTTHMVYVTDYQHGTVVVINGSTDTVTATIPLADPVLDPKPFPRGLAVDPSTNTIFVGDDGGDQVEVIDGDTNTVTNRIALPTGSGPAGVAADPGAGLVYVADQDTGAISVIDTATDGVSTLASGVTDVLALGLDPASGTLFAAARDGGTAGLGTVYVVDTASGEITYRIPRGGTSVGVTSTSGGSAYVVEGQIAGPLEGKITTITPSAVDTMSPVIVSGCCTFVFTVGQAGQDQLTASAIPPATFSATGLPAGLTLSSSGLLSGTPAAGTQGGYQIQVTASNSVGTSTQVFALNVEPPTASPPPPAVGVEGLNGAMYVQAPQLSPGWHSEGGVITGPPAVAAAPNADGTSAVSPLFVATGTDKHLYIRSLTAGWREVTPVASCLGSPAAMITTAGGVSTLTVACEGTNRALYYDTAAVPASGLPAFTTGWAYLGGTLTAGPAVAQVGGTTTFFVPGTTGHIYTRTVSTGFAEQPWACLGSPAAAVQAATGQTVFACQGTNHALWYATSTGSGWTGAASLGGSIIGGPGIAATSQQIEFYAEGTTHAVYQRTLTTGWASIGGSVINGAAATALN